MGRSFSESTETPSRSSGEADRQYDFLRSLAHELRTPLGTVFMHAQMLELGADGGTDARIGNILRGCRQISGLLEDMLDVVAAERGRLRVQREPIDINAFATGFGERHDQELQSNRIRVEPAANDPQVDCDPARLDRILVNLVGYAIHHAPAGEVITIAIRPGSQRVDVLLTIPSVIRDLDLLATCTEFENDRKRSDGQSMSLRLYIAWQLARAQGGDLRVVPSDRSITILGLTLPAASQLGSASV